MRRREPQDEGTSAVIGLLIGLTIFSASFIYIVDVAVETTGEVGDVETGNLQLTASALASLLLGRGEDWYSQIACIDDTVGEAGTATNYADPQYLRPEQI
ncbi:MAG: hypothetical protein HYT80_06800, partial [Euryarchaeota archaeon]|nr:hypothetical protein [Euryarchaeota archaeon]